MTLDKVVEDIQLDKNMTIAELIKAFHGSGGFSAKNIAIAVDIIKDMIGDKDSVNFLSFPACINATGTRGVIKEMIKEKMFDVIITTCGTLDHDIARSIKDYYHGSFFMDDEELLEQGINRLGNVLVPNESYGTLLEAYMQPILEELYESGIRDISTRDLIWEFGKRMDNEDSILHWAYKNQIPIFVPGITDGAFGSQVWQFYQNHRDFKIDILKDEDLLADIVFTAEKSGALMIGGGISKHHTIWWNQYKDGIDRAVYITTAVEYDGSLSGARMREAISWGKMNKEGTYITVEGDATVILPLIVAALL